MKRLFIGSGLLASLLIASCGDNKTANDTSADSKEEAKEQNEQKFDSTDLKRDADFAVKMADGGMLEVELGKLAMKNASSPKVKEFGKMMVDDHSKANTELMDLAKRKNISLPATMSDKCTKMYNDLSAKTGKDFDKEYMSAMVDDHQEDLDELTAQAEKGKDADLKAWAQGKVDVIKHHLEVAKSTKDGLK